MGGKDVTEELSPYIQSLTYSDAVEGKADSVDLTLNDTDGRFASHWYPEKGIRLEVFLGFADNPVPAGIFTVDETNYSGPPDRITVKGLSASVTKRMRTERSFAHEDSKLSKIVQSIADRHGLELIGDFAPDFEVASSMQHRETDLGYLARLGREYGYVFSVRGDILYFGSIYQLEAQPAVDTLLKIDVTSYSFTDKAHEVHGGARNRYFNPDTQETEELELRPRRSSGRFVSLLYARNENFEGPPRSLSLTNYGTPNEVYYLGWPGRPLEDLAPATATEATDEPQSPSGRFDSPVFPDDEPRSPSGRFVSPNFAKAEQDEADIAELHDKARSGAEAEARVSARLHRSRTRKITATITVPGNPRLLAGNNIILDGFGSRFDGAYHIEESTHSVSSSGYTTSIKVKRLRYNA